MMPFVRAALDELVAQSTDSVQEELRPTIIELPLDEVQSQRQVVVCNPIWALVITESDQSLDCNFIRSSELPSLPQCLKSSNLKLQLLREKVGGIDVWTLDHVPMNTKDIRPLLAGLVKDLITKSQAELAIPDASAEASSVAAASLTGAVRKLVTQKQRLVQVVISQQEEIQSRIARDLHDAVINDVLAVRRSLNQRNLVADDDPISQILDRIVRTIREVCHDLTPRDLVEWGLSAVLSDLVYRMSQNSQIDFTFTCEQDIPRLAETVELHLFRIIQEALNNIVKHANAKTVRVAAETDNGWLTFSVIDEGTISGALAATDRPRADRSGTGQAIARERAELINEFYPCDMQFERTESGSALTIKLRLH